MFESKAGLLITGLISTTLLSGALFSVRHWFGSVQFMHVVMYWYDFSLLELVGIHPKKMLSFFLLACKYVFGYLSRWNR